MEKDAAWISIEMYKRHFGLKRKEKKSSVLFLEAKELYENSEENI